MNQKTKPLTEDALRYIDIVLREEILSPLGRQYLVNAKIIIRRQQ